LGRISVEELQGELKPGDAGSAAYRRPAPARAAPPISTSQEQNLLRCVLAKPALAAGIDYEMLDPRLPETGALRAIAELDEAGASGGLLVDRFEGTEFQQVVFNAQAVVLEQELDPGSAEHDFRQIQLALRIRHMNQEIEALKNRVNADPRLTPELHQRIQELAQLKSQRIAPSP
jgi:hypothetical protein